MAKLLVTFIVLLTLSGSKTVFGANPACELFHSTDIESGKLFDNGSVLHDGILYPQNLQFIYKPAELNDETNKLSTTTTKQLESNQLPVMIGQADMNSTVVLIPNYQHLRGCICELRACVRKCCHKGMALVDSVCQNVNSVPEFKPDVLVNHTTVQTVVWAEENYGIVAGNTCENGSRYMLDPRYPEDVNYLYKNGTLHMPNFLADNKFHDHGSYCLDWKLSRSVNGSNGNNSENWQWVTLLCSHTEPPHPAEVTVLFGIFPFGMIISIVFLVLTFLVYLVLPELHTLHGKALMHYVGALAVAYSFLATIQTRSSHLSDGECLGYALVTYYAFILSFFWLNVMSFDIWWAFSGMGGFRGGVREAERKKFLCYLIYAWGGASLVFTFALVMDYHPSVPLKYTPRFAGEKCWLQESALFPYFYLPLLILVVANVCLFSATAFKIRAINQETKMLRGEGSTKNTNKVEDDKQRFWLYVKLFLVMGVNWSMEILSFIIGGSKWLWIITDFFNSLQGLLIFLIFVFKPKIRKLLVRRYNAYTGKPVSSITTNTRSMSSSTAATQMTTINNTNGSEKKRKESFTEKALLA